MKLLHVVFLCLLLTTNITQAQWEQVCIIGNNELRGVKFFNELTGIVVGQGGIWRSTNSGMNWTQVLNENYLRGISFIDSNNGYVVGDSGKIFRTFNNGSNWTRQGIGVTNEQLNSVSFSTVTRCIITGNNGIILRSLDGGSSWQSQGIGGPDLYSAIMNTSGEGFVFGSLSAEYVRSTINGGTNWLTILNLAGNICFDGTFLNNSSSILCVGNNGRIRKSTNGGLNWTFPQSNISSNLLSIFYVSPSEIYTVGINGNIIKSSNLGENWTNQTSGTSNTLFDIFFINQSTGWAVGSGGIVLRTGIPLYINQHSTSVTEKFIFLENYPNPFNPSTKIIFNIPITCYVTLKIYNSVGGYIETIANQMFDVGSHEIEFIPNEYSSGIYFCLLQNGLNKEAIKLILLK